MREIVVCPGCFDGMHSVCTGNGVYCVAIDGEALFPEEKELLAVRDGFANFEAMTRFWPRARLPFHGDIIHWKPVHNA